MLAISWCAPGGVLVTITRRQGQGGLVAGGEQAKGLRAPEHSRARERRGSVARRWCPGRRGGGGPGG
eukprot:2177769-Pyramimonas_sp.AAC.1